LLRFGKYWCIIANFFFKTIAAVELLFWELGLVPYLNHKKYSSISRGLSCWSLAG